jgi:hypothetical protein
MAGGTASTGVDYKQLAPGRLIFNPDETTKTLNITKYALLLIFLSITKLKYSHAVVISQ